LTAVSSLPNILIPVINNMDEAIYIIFWKDEMFSRIFITIFS
jgi:hypothetical protein